MSIGVQRADFISIPHGPIEAEQHFGDFGNGVVFQFLTVRLKRLRWATPPGRPWISIPHGPIEAVR